MIKPFMLVVAITLSAQAPFQPLNLEQAGIPDRAGARADWIKLTNQRMEMSGRTLRVAQAGDGLTLLVLAKGVEKPRHAKPIFLGKGEHALLFKAAVTYGFTRIVVQNPDTGKNWSARLEAGKPILEF
jgi:hypothetical protein